MTDRATTGERATDHAPTWTIEQVVAYATTAARFAAGEHIADPAAWSRLGASPDGLWGRYDGTAAEPYAVVVDHAGSHSRCACPSRQRPCKHAVALLVLWVRGHVPDVADPPSEIAEWLRRRQAQVASAVPAGPVGDGGSLDASDVAGDVTVQRGSAGAEDGNGDPSGADGGGAGGVDGPVGGAGTAPETPEELRERLDRLDRQRDERVARLRAGLVELDRWLEDRCRLGLADPVLARYATWDELAARLTDARAGALANRVRRLAGRVGASPTWQSEVLAELGVLHLIVQGALRLGDLPPALADRVAVLCGWQVRSADVLATAPEPGDWFVVGRSDEREDLVEVRRVWMISSTGALGLVLSFAAYRQALDESLRPGEIVTVDVHRYPGGAQRVLLGAAGVTARATEAAAVAARIEQHVTSVVGACERLGRLLADEPWAERQPLLVRAAVIHERDDEWWLGDHTGRLPLRRGVDARALAVLLAASAGQQVTCAVEWTPDGLVPLTVFLPDRTIDIGRRADATFVADAA